MEKLIFSFIIPAYNGEKFLQQSIHSIANKRLFNEGLLDNYEIIIIDDGSKDDTSKVARVFARQWNSVVRNDFIKVIKKENGQYGSVINRGIKEAKGVYFKVLDVDDTFNTSTLIELIYIAKGLECRVDVFFTDHTYEKVGVDQKEIKSLRKYIDPNIITKIENIKFPKQLITMHSIIYKTELLRNIEYSQIEDVYYSDSQYSIVPLLSAKSVYYAELPLYRYYIGRGEQSISMKTMIKNRMHQYKVMIAILENVNFTKIDHFNLYKYSVITIRRMVQWQIMLISNDKTIKNKSKEVMKLMAKVKELNPKNHSKILRGWLFFFIKIFKAKMIATLVKHGLKIYSKFNKNINVLADWD